MKPIYFTLGNRKKLMAIPDTTAHVDGHPVLTYTYSIFLDTGVNTPLQVRSKESTLHLEKIDDPNYLGYITIEKPGQLFNYTADTDNRLNSDEVQEIIENLSEVRDDPSLWKALGSEDFS
jgi:hypothetical protein